MFTDPSGMAYNITGPDNQTAFNELQGTTGVPMALNGNSVTLTNSSYVAQNPAEQKLMDVIGSQTTTVNLNTTRSDQITQNGSTVDLVVGSYGGSTIDANGHITAEQTVNLEHARRAEAIGGGTVGETVLHETLEAYVGTELNPGQGYSSNTFNMAHSATLLIAPLPQMDNFTGNSTNGREKYVGLMGPAGAAGPKILLYYKNVDTGQTRTAPFRVIP